MVGADSEEKSCETEPSSCGIWHYLQVDIVKIELEGIQQLSTEELTACLVSHTISDVRIREKMGLLFSYSTTQKEQVGQSSELTDIEKYLVKPQIRMEKTLY